MVLDEGGRMNALRKESPESSLTPSPMGRHGSREIIVYGPGSGPSSNIKSASALILDFPTSSTTKNYFLQATQSEAFLF